ncbi:MAG: helix-turn-helix protein, partial [Acidimicrobiia bacterium]|nr:helix-turn-helix protein [Acidimicrobiia bacterium]
MTATVQQQARALGDPTRHEMYRYLTSASDPVGIAELTAHFGLNHNAIRQHLAKLVAAELVVESVTEAVGPGRPPLVYEVDHRADNQWGSTGPYQRLSVLLTEIISTGDEPVEVGRRAGRRSKLSPLPSDDSAANIAAVMTSQGF